jgi:predicted phosphoadenosine phosphosulfate sulfurtransferase
MPTWRATDPETSREAAESISADSVSETQKQILNLLYVPMTDEQLVVRYLAWVERENRGYASASGIRTRRAELVKKGLVEDTEERTKLASGRRAIVWRTVQ